MFRRRVVMSALLVLLASLLVPGWEAGAQANAHFSVLVTYGGAPLPNMAIIINSSASDPRGYINSGAPNQTNGSGRYELNLPAGTYDVHVAEPITNNATYGSQVYYEVTVGGGQTVPVNFELQRPTGAISGVVLRSNGSAAAGVQVDAFGTAARGDGAPFGWGTTFTGADGRFTLGNLLPNGAYAVFVSGLGFRMDYVPVSAGANTPNVNFPTGTGVYPAGGPGSGGGSAPSPAAGPEGRMFGLGADGTLRWYRHGDPGGGSFNWVSTNFANLVGEGWNTFDAVYSGGNGVLYTVRDGVLRWYRNADPGGGTYNWATANFGNVVGDGWNTVAEIIPNGDGTIYAVRANGDLLWFRHLGIVDGTYTYAAGSGTKIGDGFNQCSRLFPGGNGVLYCVRANGDLQYWRHTSPTTGQATWAGGNIVGGGWNSNVAKMWSGGNGVIYTIDTSGRLHWYRHLGYTNGAYAWASANFGAVIGDGWSGFAEMVTGGLG